ncbi:hypothetical protein HQQ80_18300 [Microbacteriaceae bacterium VKM Ac-2855]|nr:hypothetical protein [Microbacteriaceae bacterium VKM Ac-2855]
MAVISEAVVVCTDGEGIPSSLYWRGALYRVSDQPTVWTRTSEWWRPLRGFSLGYGELPVSIGGWRFQATAAVSGQAFVFDVVGGTDEQWSVVCVYD